MSLKKLNLNRETLRTLSNKDQEEVQGGLYTALCGGRCSADTASIVNTRRVYCC